jgi:hypothetical protein
VFLVVHILPEDEELAKKRAEISTLEQELVQRELDLETLRVELRMLQAHYLERVGILLAELDDLKARAAEFRARSAVDDPLLREHADAARAKATASSEVIAALSEERSHETNGSPSDGLKRL